MQNSVRERSGTLARMRARGASKRDVGWLFLAEIVPVIVLSTIIGVIVGLVSSVALNRVLEVQQPLLLPRPQFGAPLLLVSVLLPGATAVAITLAAAAILIPKMTISQRRLFEG